MHPKALLKLLNPNEKPAPRHTRSESRPFVPNVGYWTALDSKMADGVSAFPKSSFVQCDPKSLWKYAILEDRLSDSVELRPITSHIN